MNKTIMLDLDRKDCGELAMQLFLEESGVQGQGKKFQRMYADAMEIRQVIEDRIDVKAVYSFYEDFALEGSCLEVEGVRFECRAFDQLERDWLEGLYFYAVTAGDYYLEDRPIMDQLYADIWGTAFTDAIRNVMLGRLCGDEVCSRQELSDSFGPGFYGMDVAEMHRMPLLVDLGKIGIEVKESGMMLPLKSCAGMLFKVNGKYERLDAACQHCYGSSRTCSLCSVRRHLI